MNIDRRKFLKLLGLVPVVGVASLAGAIPQRREKVLFDIESNPPDYLSESKAWHQLNWDFDSSHYRLNQELKISVNSLNEMHKAAAADLTRYWEWYKEKPR